MIVSILKFVAISLIITALVPFGLIASQRPQPIESGQELDFSQSLTQDLSTLPEPDQIAMRDGTTMPVRRYGDTGPLVILIHGSSWHGMQYHSLATKLAQDAQVLVPDLRGHGIAPERRGDVDYIGQFEDDLADLITAEKAPGQKVMMVGHSSGGGLVVRMAGGTQGGLVDHAVLLAPFLHHSAPSTRANSGGWAHVLLRRIIGLSILNGFGVTALNHMTIIQFNMPDVVLDGPLGDTATTSYSYRLNTGFAPREDYLADVAALPDFTVIVGSDDETMNAEAYAPLMSEVTGKGRYLVLPGVQHLPLVDAPDTLAALREDIRGL